MSRRACSCVAGPRGSPCGCGPLAASERARRPDDCKEESSVPSGKMNCDLVRSEVKVNKADDCRRQGSFHPGCLEGSCKDCSKNCERLSFLESPIVTSRTSELEASKENRRVQHTLNSSCEIEALESSGLCEDSGYCSFTQHSGLSEQDGSLVLEENFRNSPQSCQLTSQSPDQYPSKNLLPVLHFERVVCSTLKKNAKRNPKVDREMLREVIASGNFRLQNIIGKKMGLECVDILSELFWRGCKHLLANILTKLSDRDLINLSKVSRIWKKILENDKGAFQQYSKAMQRVFETSKLSLHASTREYVMRRKALAIVQKSSVWASPRKDAEAKVQCDPNSYSRYNKFCEIGKTLKNNESLKSCVLCKFPAKYDPYLQRATCKRESCGFDYCTKCQCTYHSSKDCSSGKLLKASCKLGPLPGTKKSKKSLQRL